jgi:hypothetical protein
LRTQVISICSLGHRDVWKLTSKLLPQFVEADEYLVFVPESEVSHFKNITDSRIQVRSQGDLGAAYADDLWGRVESHGNSTRYGWYLQQFFKIEALLNSDADRLIIWDADCVPVGKIVTFNSLGNPIFMVGAFEYNQSYFDAISRLLGMHKIQEFSFVIPGFPVPKNWVEEFKDHISRRHSGKEWYAAILDTTDFSLQSGFSETESLGTFIANQHPNEWSTFEGFWERRGQKRFGYARNFSPKKIVRVARKAGLDIVSFENWDIRGFRLIARRLHEKWTAISVKWNKNESNR